MLLEPMHSFHIGLSAVPYFCDSVKFKSRIECAYKKIHDIARTSVWVCFYIYIVPYVNTPVDPPELLLIFTKDNELTASLADNT